MAHRELRQKAIKLRLKGYSYSQIKNQIGVSKSTLNSWLYAMPLSEKRIRELQADSPIRIERFRNTMRKKREQRFSDAYSEMTNIIGVLTPREIFVAGFFLYWGEGNKTKNSSIGLTNSNPRALKFYIRWLELLDVEKKQLKVSLKLYSDMNIRAQDEYWSKELSIPTSQFRKSYIKKANSDSITYHNGFGQGTCSVVVENARLSEKVLMGLKYIQDNFS